MRLGHEGVGKKARSQIKKIPLPELDYGEDDEL